ncbi:MAG: sugar transferase [Synergistetes bacterium]|nr:sugar transferase [Synergistota bacterium]
MSERLRVNTFYARYGKRIVDVVVGSILFLVVMPLFLCIAIAVKMEDGGRVFYLQKRMGKEFVPFYLIKFRTMIEGADSMGPKITIKDDPRVTRVGRVLRKYKLDELPQLINVVKGDMSIVGPRPEVEYFVSLFREAYERILRVKPGITDYAAIEYRDEEDLIRAMGSESGEMFYVEKILPKKIELYDRYLREMSFFTDVRIMLMTMWKVIFC